MNYFHRLIILASLVMVSGSTVAQVTFEPSVLTLKYCPEALASFNAPAVQFGLEYRFKPRHAWHSELGYVFNINGATVNLQKLNGIRLLTEYRYYLGETKMSFFENFYFSFAARYIYWDSDRSGTFWRDDYAYQQRVAFKLEQHRISVNMGIGVERQLFSKLSIGFGLLIGRGVRIQNSEGLPEDGDFINPGFSSLKILEAGDSPGYPDVLLRVHLGYAIK